MQKKKNIHALKWTIIIILWWPFYGLFLIHINYGYIIISAFNKLLLIVKKKYQILQKIHEPSKHGLHIFQYEPDDHIHVLHKQDKCTIYINTSTYPDKSNIKTMIIFATMMVRTYIFI